MIIVIGFNVYMILFTSSRTMNMGGDLLEKPTTEVEDSGSYWPGNPALPPPPAPRNTFLNSQVRSLMSLSLSNSIQPPTSSSLSSDKKKLSQQRRRSSSVPPTSESSGSWPSGIGERWKIQYISLKYNLILSTNIVEDWTEWVLWNLLILKNLLVFCFHGISKMKIKVQGFAPATS